MATLRLTQSAVHHERFRVELALEGDGLPRQIAATEFEFSVTPQEKEDLRWYLEDYLQHHADPAPKIAARIERRIAEIGTALFKALFHASDDARDLWATLRDRIADTRVEVITDVREATAIPWELLRDPKTDVPLALRATTFVRAAHQTVQRPRLPMHGAVPIRILLVICRSGAVDVPFRSIASRLIKGLSESAGETFRLDVLRPPTFEQLSKILRFAKNRGNPYHIVHFDGHGIYAEVTPARGSEAPKHALSSGVLSARKGPHGYLLFETAGLGDKIRFVDGPALGKLLVETDVPVLVLNACRSAHAEASPTPYTVSQQSVAPLFVQSGRANEDIHAQVRAFGSLAQEVVDAGVAGVVAMRYNVYVVTAAQFVADLYEALASGHQLGEAVTLGRKQLEANPLREIAYQPRALQDWMVPVVYEAAPLALFPKQMQQRHLMINVTANAVAPLTGDLSPEVVKRPEVGFFGRDETLLAVDRAFDTQAIVLLQAYAGSGKSSTAVEFARWYHLTGGVAGPVLFSSFEHHKPLARVLNETIGRVFGNELASQGVHWLALTDDERRDVALQVLEQVPVLWIWDNVEPVSGFPAGTPSVWSDAEQKALADFLRAAALTTAKFLLTSRRAERDWLGQLPVRIQMPPMPMQERVQIARALAEKHGRPLVDVDDWTPLLRFTAGNPLTITVLVGQALRDGLGTKAQIEAFVGRLSAGEAKVDDEVTEGREKSLAASLHYGFENAFGDGERRQVALLHWFHGFVDVDTLVLMGLPQSGECIPEVRGLSREVGIILLDRAAEVGLLTSHGGGFYSIHPAVPWFFKSLSESYYGALADLHSGRQVAVARAFVLAMHSVATKYRMQESPGEHTITGLVAEEANLLHAWNLARTHGWWLEAVGTITGLELLYDKTSRSAELTRLVDATLPDVVDIATGGPLPGRHLAWEFITEYRAKIAAKAQRWKEAEQLQRTCVDSVRRRVAPVLERGPSTLTFVERNDIKSLASFLDTLGDLLRQQGIPACLEIYEETLRLYQRIQDRHAEALAAGRIGAAYGGSSPALRDLSQAEHWYLRKLELLEEDDRQGRGHCLSALGRIARERFKEARAANKPQDERNRHLNAALRFYEQALEHDPPYALDDLAVDHMQLGNTHVDGGDFGSAMSHWRQSVEYFERASDQIAAAKVRRNMAKTLAARGLFVDARAYADAALRDFATYGDRMANEIRATQDLIDQIIQSDKREQDGTI